MSRRRPRVQEARRPGSRIAGVVAAVAIAVLLVLMASPAATEPAAIRAKRAEIARIHAQLDVINAQVESAAEAYNGARFELGRVTRRIDENVALATRAERDIRTERGILAQRLRAIYARGQPSSVIEVLLTSGSITDAAEEADLLDRIGEGDAATVHTLRDRRATLARLHAQLVVDRASARRQVAAKAAEQARVESLLAQRKAIFDDAGADLRRLITAEKERRAREAALARQRASAASFSTGGVPLAVAVPSGNANAEAAAIALHYLGVPYVWGGASPSGFDCSGLASYVYAQVGKSVPHYTRAMWAAFPQVSSGDLQPGDLVFFFGLDHVGIYLGGDQFVQAPHTGDFVKVSGLSTYPGYVGAVRP